MDHWSHHIWMRLNLWTWMFPLAKLSTFRLPYLQYNNWAIQTDAKTEANSNKTWLLTKVSAAKTKSIHVRVLNFHLAPISLFIHHFLIVQDPSQDKILIAALLLKLNYSEEHKREDQLAEINPLKTQIQLEMQTLAQAQICTIH